MNEIVKDWKMKELDPCYIFVYASKEELYIRERNNIKKKDLYTIIGINVMGRKRVLGLYVEEDNNNHYWMNSFENLKDRGVKDILFLMVGNNKALRRGAKLVFSNINFVPLLQEIIDNSTKYIARKNYRELSMKLHESCIKESRDEAVVMLKSYVKELSEDEIVKYIVKQYEDDLLDSYKYSFNLRKVMYSMAFIDGLRRKYKREIRKREIFDSTDSLIFDMLKLYINIEKSWIYSKRSWNDVINLVGKDFKERIYPYL